VDGAVGSEGSENDGGGGQAGGEAVQGDGGHGLSVCHALPVRNAGLMNLFSPWALVAVMRPVVGGWRLGAAGLFFLGAAAAAEVTEDFESLAAGAVPSSLMVIEGGWGIVEEAGNKVLELHSEPVVDGAILIGPSLQQAGVVSAKIRAGKSRRAHPRMGVGLYGVSGVKFRLVPARRVVEMVLGDEVAGEAPFDGWSEEVWWRVELAVVSRGDGWSAEARVWLDGGERPEAATVRVPLPDGPGQGRASLLGTPFANKPVHFDEVRVRDESAAAPGAAAGGR